MRPVVGIVGLGRLGLPIAVTYARQGLEVLAYDVDPRRMTLDALSPHEHGFGGQGRLIDEVDDTLPLRFTSLAELGREADCIFVVVQTPHDPPYEGVTPLPETRADFRYDILVRAVEQVVALDSPAEIGIMSTVLPGTMSRLVVPRAPDRTVVYCPQFAAMGTVAWDLQRPEFALVGHGKDEPTTIPAVLSSFSEAPVFRVSHETAELAKVMYNTFVSAKVTLSNLIQLMSEETGADAADVYRIIRSADRRLTSTAYIGPGLGDGGPCHPRDNIAMSWLARRIGLSTDLFSAVMETRQSYTQWLAERFIEVAEGRPMVLLGTSFKPGTDLKTGSAAILLADLLDSAGAAVTLVGAPADLSAGDVTAEPAAFFIGCPEPEFTGYPFPPGSVVVDPWFEVDDSPGVTVVRPGKPRI